MIVTDLEHLHEQLVMTPGFQTALDFLRRSDLAQFPDGIHEIDGQRVFANFQTYESKPVGENVKFEGHRKYIDIQYVISGSEMMGWTVASAVTPTVPYNEANDIWFSDLPPTGKTFVRVDAGQAVVFYPIDAHAPTLANGVPAHVHKVIVKVVV